MTKAKKITLYNYIIAERENIIMENSGLVYVEPLAYYVVHSTQYSYVHKVGLSYGRLVSKSICCTILFRQADIPNFKIHNCLHVFARL